MQIIKDKTYEIIEPIMKKEKYYFQKYNNPMKRPEIIKKMSKTKKRLFKQGKIKLSPNVFKIGHIPWCKGKKIGFIPKKAFRKGHIPWNKGKILKGLYKTNSNILKSLYKNGVLIPSMKGKHHNKKTKEEISKSMLGKFSLNKHPNWMGGISFEPYTSEFNKLFKELIRQRDGFLCLKCGMREEDSIKLFHRKLHIHHINYDKQLTIKENCCALCLRCNVEVNKNRIHWTKFFQSLLSEMYGYEYIEGKIVLEMI